MAADRKKLGIEGEDLAAAHLRSRGFRILERNARLGRLGELDIVALDGRTLVFVEVKTRRAASFGSPEDAVTPSKLRTVAACAEAWRATRGWTDRPYRIDVVAIEFAAGTPLARHLPDIRLD